LRNSALIAAFLLGSCAVPGPAHAQQAGAGDTITVYLSFQAPQAYSPKGYAERVYVVRNNSRDRTHKVTLIYPAPAYGHSVRSISRTVELAPLSTTLVRLLQPELLMEGSANVGVIIDGKTQPGGVWTSLHVPRDNFPSVQGSSQPWESRRTILLSQKVGFDIANHIDRGMGGRQVWLGAGVPLTDWSPNWLAYSGYDGIVVTSGELAAANKAGTLSALIQYVECGGSLLVLGAWEVPDAWKRRQQALGSLTNYYAGFGQCLVARDTNFQGWDQADWRHLFDSLTSSRAPLQIRSITEANRVFPVAEDVSIPVRGLFLIVLIFAVVIGPINLHVLSRARRRIWMLWTVPILSLLTCVLVIGYTFLGEGWDSRVRSEGLTILDESSGRATTVGWTAFYTPTVPRDGLHFSSDTDLLPQLALDYRYYSGRGRSFRSVDWTREQHLATGWLTARIPAHFQVRRSEARREHVTIRKSENGSLSVQNELGADIHNFYVAGKQGKIYSASNIAAGKEATLTATGLVCQDGKEAALREAYRKDWLQQMQLLREHPEAYLLPGCYVAILESSPFIEEGMRSATNRRGRAVVFGILKEIPRAD
jgi:hypothetical protein